VYVGFFDGISEMSESSKTKEGGPGPAAEPSLRPAEASDDTGADIEAARPDMGDEEPVSAQPTAEEIARWQERAAKADQHWDRLLRLTAEFDNFRKRAQRERQEAVQYANESLLARLVTVLDHFEMALAAIHQSSTGNLDSFRTGVQMIYSQLRQVLQEAGLEEVLALGQPFDPQVHEAVQQQESSDVPEDHVLSLVRKGYKLKSRLIRPAQVVVARPPSA